MKRMWGVAAAGILAWGCADRAPAGSVAVTPAAFRLANAESMPIRLTWTPSRPLTETREAPIVFVHLIHPTDKVVRTFDHPLPGSWQPGAPLSYEIDIALSGLGNPLPAGSYQLAVGLYDPASGYRWPLLTDGADLDRHAYAAAAVEVAPPRDDERFTFEGGWGEVAPGTTKQIVASRWLQAGGAIETYAAGGTLLLWLRLGDLPAGAAGVGARSLAIDGNCLRAPVAIEAPGSSQVTLRLEPGPTDEPCSLHLRPSAGGAGAWARLDGIAWQAPRAEPAARVGAERAGAGKG